MDSLGLSACVDRHFAQPGNNRGLSPSVYVRTLILTRHTGAFRLDDVDRFQRDNKALLPMLGLERVPGAVAIGKWLRRMGAVENIQGALNEVNRVLLATSLRRLQAVTLEIDATEVEANKANAKWTYKGHRGDIPVVGHIAGTDQVAAVDFRGGNTPSNKDNLAFIQRCEGALPTGVRMKALRIDAAGAIRKRSFVMLL